MNEEEKARMDALEETVATLAKALQTIANACTMNSNSIIANRKELDTLGSVVNDRGAELDGTRTMLIGVLASIATQPDLARVTGQAIAGALEGTNATYLQSPVPDQHIQNVSDWVYRLTPKSMLSHLPPQ